MTLVETKQFFAALLELDYSVPKHRATFRKIMKMIDIDNQHIAYKENVLQFFSLSNFTELIVVQDESAHLPKATVKNIQK